MVIGQLHLGQVWRTVVVVIVIGKRVQMAGEMGDLAVEQARRER